jgi:hypothetical protein
VTRMEVRQERQERQERAACTAAAVHAPPVLTIVQRFWGDLGPGEREWVLLDGRGRWVMDHLSLDGAVVSAVGILTYGAPEAADERPGLEAWWAARRALPAGGAR